MKNLFPEYSNPSQGDHQAIWDRALFVFDTNVLLNLYRYRTSTRNELLGLLDKLTDRIWIPHHVALEFQRNRLAVISAQIAQFESVRTLVTAAGAGLRTNLAQLNLRAQHSIIDPDPLLRGFDNLTREFFSELENLRTAQPGLTAHDALKDRLENLFHNKVGEAPADSGSLEQLYNEAEARYGNRIPPGYMDGDKISSVFRHGGLAYQGKYSDFLVWRQLLDYVKSSGSKHIVFVNNDTKNDWWLKVRGKRIGPRPELIEEMKNYSGAETFLMYTTEEFLEYSRDSLHVHVSEATITDVRDVSRVADSAEF